MTTVLCIAGHGKRANGSFDSGAVGKVPMGEHKYMRDVLFPAMKKFAPSNFVFFSSYNVFSYKNIVNLAKSYGNDTVVVEFHFDAADNANRSGGHVIVHDTFKADKIDMNIVNVIEDFVGLAGYAHRGDKGISGRSNLGNLNRCASGGVNYRLIELGFGTNANDANVMLTKAESYGKALVEAILNKSVSGKPQPTPAPQTPQPAPKPAVASKQPLAIVAQQVIDGAWGNNPERTRKLENMGYDAKAVQTEVNRILNGAPVSEPTSLRGVAEIAQQVIDGEWGNNPEREKRLKDAGYNPTSVQNEVNKILGGGKSTPAKKPAGKSIDTLVAEVLAGKHGNGDARKKSLGANYNAVMAVINGKSTPKPEGKTVDRMAREVLDGKHGDGHANRQKSLGVNNTTYQQVRKRVNQLAK